MFFLSEVSNYPKGGVNMHNPELRSQFIQQGYFPPEEECFVKLGAKGLEFYRLLLEEWEQSGNRTIVHGRLLALGRKAGFKSVGSVLYSFERKSLLVFLKKSTGRFNASSCRVVARPYMGTAKRDEVHIPSQCSNKGICRGSSVWCLPSDTPPVMFTRSDSAASYLLMIDIIEGSDGNIFEREVLEDIIRRATKKTRTQETITDLLELGMLRKVPQSDRLGVIARPYVLFSDSDKQVYIPSQCQPPANRADFKSEVVPELVVDEDLPAEFDDVVLPLEEASEPKSVDESELVVPNVTQVETEFLLVELEKRIRREHANYVGEKMEDLARSFLAPLREIFATGGELLRVEPLCFGVSQMLETIRIETEEMNTRLRNLAELKKSLGFPIT